MDVMQRESTDIMCTTSLMMGCFEHHVSMTTDGKKMYNTVHKALISNHLYLPIIDLGNEAQLLQQTTGAVLAQTCGDQQAVKKTRVKTLKHLMLRMKMDQ